ncbi:hypothetical protein HMPREF3201_01130 [Megasphaera sp. MJR8396C]|nr:hypothetical protein HMPREF3201_01130 [Megasphaera sp. MJR8396C]
MDLSNSFFLKGPFHINAKNGYIAFLCYTISTHSVKFPVYKGNFFLHFLRISVFPWLRAKI